DVPLWDVKAGAVRDQSHTDQQQEAQRQHLHGRMTFDKISERSRSRQHDCDSDDDCRSHTQNAFTMPTAVITLSSENTTSSTMICTITLPVGSPAACGLRGPLAF